MLVAEHRRAIRNSKMQAAAIVGGAVALAITGLLTSHGSQ
jgi:hypothetical protein